MPPKKTKPSFTETIAQLETLIATLDSSDTSLEDSLINFEQGIQLLRKAQQELSDSEQKVQTLTEDTSLVASQSSGDKATQ